MRTRRKRMVLRVAAIAAAIGLTALVLSATTWGAKPSASRYAIVQLDTRPGYQWSGVGDLNEVGDVVGVLVAADGYPDAVAWKVTVSSGTVSVDEYPLSLPPLPLGYDRFVDSAAEGVNDLGEIVGNVTVASGVLPVVRKAVYWKDAVSAPLFLPPLPGYSYSWAMSINNDGIVVGMAGNGIPDNNRRPVAWKVGLSGIVGPIDLGILSGTTYSDALDVNDASSGIVRVVGTSSNGVSVFRAVLWEIDANTLLGSGPVELGFLRNDRPFSEGYAINDQGTTCGDSVNIAFRKPYGNAMQQLAQFKPGMTWAYDINNRNEVVGKNDHYDQRSGAFQRSYSVMWQADGKVVNIENYIGSSGWYRIYDGRAINDLGWIAGHGAIAAPGESRALVMVPK